MILRNLEMELIDRTFSLLGKSEKNLEFMEGELIFSSLAIQYNPEILDETLPFELDFNLKLNEVTNIYGNYDWKRDYDNAYEWTIVSLL